MLHMMRFRLATSAALGAVLALALTVTSVATPAFAAKTRPDIIPTNPTTPITTQPITAPQPAPQTSTVTFLPDVRVVYLNKSAGSGGKVTYRFRVENIGAASASNVALGTKVYQRAVSGNVSSLQSGSAGTIAQLGQDQSKEIAVTCTPQAGYVCDGATLQAYVTDDLNPANNSATNP